MRYIGSAVFISFYWREVLSAIAIAAALIACRRLMVAGNTRSLMEMMLIVR